jgi:hypothetical protein
MDVLPYLVEALAAITLARPGSCHPAARSSNPAELLDADVDQLTRPRAPASESVPDRVGYATSR